MKKLREIRTKIDAYIQTHKPAAFIMWLLVLLFPLWLSLSGNAISFPGRTARRCCCARF